MTPQAADVNADAAIDIRHAGVLESLEPHHTVQFYEDDDYLCRVVANFLSLGIRANQPALVIATPSHIEGLTRGLASEGHDVDLLLREGSLTLLDARATLSSMMDGNTIDPKRFRETVGHTIERILLARKCGLIRGFGEMVDLLWKDGNPEAALQLEELWNELSARYTFSLLCGYSMTNFSSEAQAAQFQGVCSCHHHVIPTERYMEAEGADVRLREISQLQQRSRALDAEIENRRRLEQALRLALEDREAAQTAGEGLAMREQAARAEAEAANRLKDEFLAILSHELRTPLNAILGWAQIITSPHSDPPMVRRGLDVIQRNASSQLHLVEDLLDVSRIITGKMIVRSDVVSLASVVVAGVDAVRSAAGAKGIELTLRVDGGLRPVWGDVDRLRQVVWNLLSNAVKFTPPNGHVVVSLVQEEQEARLDVRDDGEGIADEFLPFVFDRFRLADPGPTRVHGGLGLGLAVVRHLVEAHGGRVSVDSKGRGLGSTFTVRLPNKAVPAAPGRRLRP